MSKTLASPNGRGGPAKAGSGINGILWAAPIADAAAAIVVLALTLSFFRKLKKENCL